MSDDGLPSPSASTASLSLRGANGTAPEQRPLPSPSLTRHPSSPPPSCLTPTSTDRVRKAFFRAASFLQEAYYIWRAHTYDQSLVARVHSPTQIHLVRDHSMECYDAPFKLCELALYPFPMDVGAGGERDGVREALLSTCMCEDAAVVMGDMIERVLGPLTTHISEISIRVLNPSLTVHLVPSRPSSRTTCKPAATATATAAASLPPNTSVSTHTTTTDGDDNDRNDNAGQAPAPGPDPAILNHYAHHARLLTGDEYALDLTAAQYGHLDRHPLPWHAYLAARVQTFYFHVPLGGLRLVDDAYACAIRAEEGWRGVGGGGGGGDYDRDEERMEDVRSVAWWCMGWGWDALLEAWEAQNGRVAAWAAGEDERVWRAKKAALLGWLRSGVEGLVDEGGLEGVVREFGARAGKSELRLLSARMGRFRRVYPGLEGLMGRRFVGVCGTRMGFNEVRDGLWRGCEDMVWRDEREEGQEARKG